MVLQMFTWLLKTAWYYARCKFRNRELEERQQRIILLLRHRQLRMAYGREWEETTGRVQRRVLEANAWFETVRQATQDMLIPNKLSTTFSEILDLLALEITPALNEYWDARYSGDYREAL